ncbi:MAG: hypothetical protein U0670_13595 [Anaerolineae bacterium]
MGRKYSLDFRKEETGFVMGRWSADLSCSLVGVGSIGKSNLLRHLADPNVQKHYRPTSENLFTPVVIDANALGPIDATANDTFRCWAGYELLMHRIYITLFPFKMIPEEDAQRFYDFYQALQDGSNPLYGYMGLRYFELGLSLFTRNNVRFVFMLDEFEELVHQLPVKFFQTLRGIRDTNKESLLFLTFSRAPLSVIIDRQGLDPLAIESFMELFTDSVCYVGPYNETDAQKMIVEMAERYDKRITPDMSTAMQKVTGRYAGLIRTTFSVMDTLNANWQLMSIETLAATLLARYPIRMECRTIWTSLTPSEQYVLKAVAQLVPYQANEESEMTVSMLMQKRLLRLDKTQQMLEIDPPIFRAFVNTNPE